MNIQQVKIEKVKPYDKNPRKNKAAVDYVANSIKEFGFQQPIVVDKDMVGKTEQATSGHQIESRPQYWTLRSRRKTTCTLR